MRSEHQRVDTLQNIGPTVAQRLLEIGVRTRADLQAMGSAEAYRRIRAKHPGKTMPICYYLYSLEGALRGCHWDALGDSVKASLSNQVRPNPNDRPGPKRARARR